MQEKVIVYTNWHRNWFRYQYIIRYDYPHQRGEITVYWGIITHHLVKWIHGEESMDKMIFDRIEELKRELSGKSDC